MAAFWELGVRNYYARDPLGFDFPPTLMVGTSLAAVVFTSASGAWNNSQINNVDNKTTLAFATSGVIGIILGSLVFSSIARYGTLIDLLIGLAFLWPALRMLNEGLFPKKTSEPVETTVPGSRLAKIDYWLFSRFFNRNNRALRRICLSSIKCICFKVQHENCYRDFSGIISLVCPAGYSNKILRGVR